MSVGSSFGGPSRQTAEYLLTDARVSQAIAHRIKTGQLKQEGTFEPWREFSCRAFSAFRKVMNGRDGR